MTRIAGKGELKVLVAGVGMVRVLNKSQRRAKFTSFFTWTRCLLFFENYPPPPNQSQKLMMSVFCSNTLIFARQCWKCTLRGPDLKIFPKGMLLDPPLIVNCAFSVRKSQVPSMPTLKLLFLIIMCLNRDLARWMESCILIGYQSERDGAFLALSWFPLVPQGKSCLFGLTTNPLLTKRVQSWWLNNKYPCSFLWYNHRKRTWPISGHLDLTLGLNQPAINAVQWHHHYPKTR